MTDLVNLIEIWKSIGQLDVLKGISMDVKRGERLALIGPSGSN